MAPNIKMILFGVCLNNDDPLLAGRIRAVTDDNYSGNKPQDYDIGVCQKISQDNKDTYPRTEDVFWSPDDPHISAPLLPYYINVIPQANENVKIFVYSSDNAQQNREYIGPSISQPHKLDFEAYPDGRLHTSKGIRVQAGRAITDSSVSEGSFAYPGSVAINGRNNVDVVLGTRQLVMRAGKFTYNTQKPEFPIYNVRQSLIQVDNFEKGLTLVTEEKKETKIQESPINYLVEYDILDLVPSDNLFNGSVTLYKVESLPDKEKITTKNIGLTTPVLTVAKKVERARLSFFNQSFSGVTTLVNNFLEEVDNRNGKKLTDPIGDGGFEGFVDNGTFIKNGEYIDISSAAPRSEEILALHPFYFRPSMTLRTQLNSNDTLVPNSQSAINATKVKENIRLIGVNGGQYYGLSWSRNQKNVPTEQTNQKFDKENTETKTQGVITMLTDKIVLYSHDTRIPNRDKTIPLVDNTNIPSARENLGIDQKTLIKLIDKETEPLVRGDQLKKALERIVDFLKYHEHKEPGTPTVDKTQHGGKESWESLETMIKEFDKTVLNKNIRIN